MKKFYLYVFIFEKVNMLYSSTYKFTVHFPHLERKGNREREREEGE
jgi:hypothetical protein